MTTSMREIGWHGRVCRSNLIRRSPRMHLPVNVVARTQYDLGGRGVDWIRNKVGSDPETIVFPIYDGHGNMIYTLTREANDSHELGNNRIYGAWGELRHDGNPGDGPNTQYCANLGHKKDNESGLTYMRARYYEPWTGRFINEDPAMDGANWYAYCGNDPVNLIDESGRSAFWDALLMGAGGIVGTYFGIWLGHLAWSAVFYHHERMRDIHGISDRFDRVIKIHGSLWAGLMRDLAGGVLAFAVGWLVMLEGVSNLKIGLRATLVAAIGFAMGFVGAFYSDMLLELILYESGV